MEEVRFVAEQLDKLMKEREVSNQDLAEKVGLGRTTIYYLRKGREGRFVTTSFDKLVKIADALGVSHHYFLEESGDSSLVQKKMSALVADIANVAEKLSSTKQREFRELGNALVKMERSRDVDLIYNELMELITLLIEIDGGDTAISKLLDHLQSLRTGTPSPTVTRRTRRRSSVENKGESVE